MKTKMMKSAQDTMIECKTAAFAALAASSLLTSAALFNTAQAESFNADFYLNHYDDLKAAFGNDTAAAGTHWQTYGIPESRRGSTQYDGGFYRYLYPDIVNVHGSDYRAILTHWNVSGINEGRRASREFDAPYYLSQYSDLQAAFGTDYVAATNHWIRYGIAEGRRGTAGFDVQHYLNNNADLQAAFSTNYLAAQDHAYTSGRSEGRIGAPSPEGGQPEPSAPAPEPAPAPAPQAAFISDVLKAHNDERALYHNSMLQWSDALAASAQQWANTLAQENSGLRHSDTGNGENTYASAAFTSEAPADSIYVDATQSWISEKQFYSYAPTGSDCQAGQVCGHFTQVIWRNTTSLGCGRATSQTADADGWYWTYVVCQYSAAGNVTGQHAY